MSKSLKITKYDIVNIAYKIVKNEGTESLNVRRIAKELHCSIGPVYYQFKNFKDLQDEVLKKVYETYHNYMLKNLIDNPHAYKQLGINYISFAKKEPKLFQIIFMTKSMMETDNFLTSDSEIFDTVIKYGSISTGLSKEDMSKYHKKMWIFTHGIACLLAMQTCSLSDEEIGNMLTEEYYALNLLGREKNNEKDN